MTKTKYTFIIHETWKSEYEVDAEELENPESEQEAVQAFYDLIIHNDEACKTEQIHWDLKRVDVKEEDS
tara:strand:- start:185 stop:391 length:207 start_codon:yes stop_codon:yes gene_type:complete